MATAIGAHLSPEEFQWRMEDLASQAALEKIYATEAAIEASLEADYLYAEYTVMKEGGDINDLRELYMEAEQAAAENKEGLFRKIINWITRNVSRFIKWIGNLFGGGSVPPEQKVTVKKFEYNTGKSIIDKFNQFKTSVENILTGLEQKTGIDLKDIGGVLGSAGLGFLAGSKFAVYKKENDKGAVIEITGADLNETQNRLNSILDWVKKIIPRITGIVDKYKANVAKNQENFKQKNAAKAANTGSTPTNTNTQDAKEPEKTGETATGESVSVDATLTVDDLFGYITEARNEKQQKAMQPTGTKNAKTDGNKPAIAKDNSKKGTQATSTSAATNNASTANNNSSSQTTDDKNNKTGTKTTATNNASTANNNSSSQTTDADDKSEDISTAQEIISYALAIAQTIRDVVVGIMESFRNVLSGAAKNVDKSEDNTGEEQEDDSSKTDETEAESQEEPKKRRKIFGRKKKKKKKNKGEESGEQPANQEQPTDQEQTEGETQESTRELFGIDESEFDYLMEMTEEEEAEIAYLAENL